jgi:hypothetical protein
MTHEDALALINAVTLLAVGMVAMLVGIAVSVATIAIELKKANSRNGL